jgi:hypothetical protein
MNLQKRFTEQQLERIIDEATIYMRLPGPGGRADSPFAANDSLPE